MPESLQRHRMLTLVMGKQTTNEESAGYLEFSYSGTNELVRRLRSIEGRAMILFQPWGKTSCLHRLCSRIDAASQANVLGYL